MVNFVCKTCRHQPTVVLELWATYEGMVRDVEGAQELLGPREKRCDLLFVEKGGEAEVAMRCVDVGQT